MATVKDPSKLPTHDLVALATGLQHVLYWTDHGWDEFKEWDSNTFVEIGALANNYGLAPIKDHEDFATGRAYLSEHSGNEYVYLGDKGLLLVFWRPFSGELEYLTRTEAAAVFDSRTGQDIAPHLFDDMPAICQPRRI